MRKRISFISVVCLLLLAMTSTTPSAAQTGGSDYNPQQGERPVGPQKDTYVKGLTAGRTRSLVAGVLALTSIVTGVTATRKGKRTGRPAKSMGIICMLMAIAAIGLSVAHLSASAGAQLGSGSGKAGAVVALVFGLAGALFGALALRKI